MMMNSVQHTDGQVEETALDVRGTDGALEPVDTDKKQDVEIVDGETVAQ